MADYPRFNEMFEIALREMILRNPDLTEETIRTLGTDSNSIAAMMASVGEEVVRQCAVTATNRLMGTAENEELDRVIYDWFGLIRNDAASSMVAVKFTRSGSTAGTLPAGFKVATADGVEFQLAIPLSFGTGDPNLTGTCRCSVTGIIGNVGVGAVNQMIDTASFDTTFTCTNLARSAGGGPRESDDEFKARARQFWLVAQRGTLGAIQVGALEVDGVGVAAAREVPIPDPNGTRPVGMWVSLTVADRSGYANALLEGLVSAEEDNWRAAGVYVEVLAAIVSITQITATFSFTPGSDTIAATERIRQAIVNYVNGLRIEESIRPDALWDIIRRDSAVVKSSVAVSEPAGPISPAPGSRTLIRTDYQHVKLN